MNSTLRNAVCVLIFFKLNILDAVCVVTANTKMRVKRHESYSDRVNFKLDLAGIFSDWTRDKEVKFHSSAKRKHFGLTLSFWSDTASNRSSAN